MSAFYHTVSNHSQKVAKQYNVLDYVGIVALIVGSFVPSVYYGLWCHANLQKVYWTMVSLSYNQQLKLHLIQRKDWKHWSCMRGSLSASTL